MGLRNDIAQCDMHYRLNLHFHYNYNNYAALLSFTFSQLILIARVIASYLINNLRYSRLSCDSQTNPMIHYLKENSNQIG